MSQGKSKSKKTPSKKPSKKSGGAKPRPQRVNLDDIFPIIAECVSPLRIADMSGNILYKNQPYVQDIESGAMEPDAPDLIEIIQQLESLHHPLEFDLRINRNDKVFLYKTHHQLIAPKNKTAFVISRFVDATNEDLIKTRLQLMQSRLDDVIKLSSDWVWETDDKMRITVTSQRLYELLGFHPREIIGCNIFSLGSAAAMDLDHVTGMPMAVQRLTPFRNLNFSITDKRGEIHTLLLSGMPNFDRMDGKFLGYRGTARDVTQELTAKRHAKLLEQRLAMAIGSMSEGFALFDASGGMVMINDVFRGFYPKTAKLLDSGVGKTEWLRQAVMQGDIDIGGKSVDDWIQERLENWQNADCAMEIKLADSRYVLIHDHKTDDGGRVSIQTDITGLKNHESELIFARDDARNANRAKGEFFAKMSHELRTPLNAVIGFSDIMKDEKLGAMGSPQYKLYAQDINDSATHLLNLINDILDVSKAEVGKLELIEQNVSVISAVQSTLRMLSPRAEKSGVTLDASGVDPNLVLRADQKKLRQILINLVSNAVKFTKPGGVVSTRTYINANGLPVIEVRDNGIGMREEDIPKALTPFSQIDNNLNQKQEGTGLGLPVCVALAELHGGKLDLQSAPGKGTAVSITLPHTRVVKTINHPNIH